MNYFNLIRLLVDVAADTKKHKILIDACVLGVDDNALVRMCMMQKVPVASDKEFEMIGELRHLVVCLPQTLGFRREQVSDREYAMYERTYRNAQRVCFYFGLDLEKYLRCLSHDEIHGTNVRHCLVNPELAVTEFGQMFVEHYGEERRSGMTLKHKAPK